MRTEAAPEPRYDLTTIGETMLRLSVPVGARLEMAATLDARPGGAESNVAALLARLGLRTAWCGALPESPLGRLVANHLRLAGVDLDGVAWRADGRLGTYYVEFAAPPRPTQVIYDRADSCAARLAPEQVAWTHLRDTRLLHLTGITPALSASCHAIVVEAQARARQAGIPTSFDVNYRAKLWSPSEAASVLAPLMTGVDLLFCSRADALRLFEITGSDDEMVTVLGERMKAGIAVMSIGEGGAVAWDGSTVLHAPAVPATIIDRPGAGDALAAGVIYGWLDGDLAMGLRYGTLLAALALSQSGDMVVTTRAEVESLLASGGGIIR